jgi:predicted transcriptional regulator
MVRTTKKELAVRMHDRGMRVNEIAQALHCAPSYVANALIERGSTSEYVDLYTSTGPQNRYAARLAGMLRFKDVAAAQESVRQIDALYEEYAALRDRCGMHQCQVLVLTGKNRAEGIGKWQEAQVFADWLVQHLGVQRPEPDPVQLTLLETQVEPAADSGRITRLAA